MKKIPKPKVVPISSSRLVKLFPPIKVYTIWQLFKGEHKCHTAT